MYKDTAKWLLGFVPLTTLATLGVALVPSGSTLRALGFHAWRTSHGAVLVGAVLALLGGALVVTMCLYVLLAPRDAWSQVKADQTWFSNAFSEQAVGRPYFMDSTQFDAADEVATNPDGNATAQDKEAVALVTQRILDLSEQRNARVRFRRFGFAYGIGLVLIVGGSGIAVFGRPVEPTPITRPVPAVVHVAHAAEDGFRSETGCKVPARTEAVAVDGTAEHPVLRLYGPGCRSERWTPPTIDGLTIVVG